MYILVSGYLDVDNEAFYDENTLFSAHESFKTCIVEETKECSCSEGNCRDEENPDTAAHFAKEPILQNSISANFLSSNFGQTQQTLICLTIINNGF
jgi:hypothetical protein